MRPKNSFLTWLVAMSLLVMAVFVCTANIHLLLNKHIPEIYPAGMESAEAGAETDCCAMVKEPIGISHQVLAILPVVTLFLLVVLVGLFTVRFQSRFVSGYARTIRRHLGSFAVLNPFLDYFRFGLLNPKIF